MERFEELTQESFFGGREEELFVGEILGKGRLVERKRSEIGGRHGVGSWVEIGVCFVECASSAPGGSKGREPTLPEVGGIGIFFRFLRAFLIGSTG